MTVKARSDDVWNDYMHWHSQGSKTTIKKIDRLIKEIDRIPFTGIGKPEPPKHDLPGRWSRRITDKHRLIYNVDETTIYFYSCKDYY